MGQFVLHFTKKTPKKDVNACDGHNQKQDSYLWKTKQDEKRDRSALVSESEPSVIPENS
jgi:hypothetical protein